jgi:hypothetical protein
MHRAEGDTSNVGKVLPTELFQFFKEARGDSHSFDLEVVITAPCSLYIYSCSDKKPMRDVEVEGPAAVSMQLLKSVKTDICDFE